MNEQDRERSEEEREAAEARAEAEREAEVERAEAEVDEAAARVEELGSHGGGAHERDAFEGVADRIAAAEERLRAARERVEAAREAYHAARSEHRAERHAERQRERDARRAEREGDREARREERRERREEHRRMRATFGFGPRGFNFDLGDLIDGPGGEEFTETVDGAFTVAGMPTLRVRNVSGETRISVGAAGEVRIHATKRVRGSSAEKAKRLLQNIEVRMEQHRDEVTVNPHLFEQDRGWLDLFRGGRVSVDLEIAVPREARIEAHTVSGDLRIAGTRGPVEAQSVSGDVGLEDLQGPLWLKTVSGDAACSGYVGFAEVNSVSGDVSFENARVRDLDLVTVSGDVEISGELAPGREHRVKTISGDVTLALAAGSYEVAYKTMSGDLEASRDATVTREGRKDRTVALGGPGGEVRVHVKTVSGDLTVRRSSAAVPREDEAAAESSARAGAPRTPPAPPAPPPPRVDVREVLDRLARGELDVDAAAAAIDEARGGR